MGGSEVHSLIELVTHESESKKSKTLYVDEDSATTMWTFNSAGEDRYTLSAASDEGTSFLAVDDGQLVMTDNAENASQFRVTADKNGRIQLMYDGKYIMYTPDSGNGSYSLSSDAGSNTWLNLIESYNLTDDHLITCSAIITA